MDPSDSPTAERDMVRRAQEGDQVSFALLIEKYHERLTSLIHLRLGGRLRELVELEDVLQETYMNAWTAFPRFQWRGKNALFHWLGGIAENVIRNLHRHHFETGKRDAKTVPLSGDRSGTPDVLAELSTRGTSPAKKLQRKERFARLEAALDHLIPEHREVILLARVRGLPTTEIAEQMGRTREAVAMLLYRATRQLRDAFGSTESFYLPLSALESLEEQDLPPKR